MTLLLYIFIQEVLPFSDRRSSLGKMPEGGGQSGGGGGGHTVLEGSYELHDTVGTGGFAKVISRFLNVYFKRKSKKVSLLGPL